MKLRWHILLLILFILSISTSSIFWLTNYQASTLNKNSEKILAKTIVKSLREAVIQDVIDGNRIKVSNLLKTQVSQDTPIHYIFVTTAGHKTFAHSFSTGFPAFLVHSANDDDPTLSPGTHLVRKYKTTDGLIFEYEAPLLEGLDMKIHIGMNQNFFTEQFSQNKQTVLLLSSGVFIISFLFVLFFGRRITKPLSEFSDQITLFGQGQTPDFSALRSAPYEILQLANAMQTASSEREKAISLALQREQNLSITLNSIGDAVITTDENGLVTRMNPVAEKLTQWSHDEALGVPLKTIFPIINASTREEITNPAEQVMKTGEIVYLSNHTTLISRDSTEFQIADSAAPIRDDSGKIKGIVLVFNDVTEQYHLREAAAKSRRDLQAIMDNSPISIYVKGPDDIYSFVNKEFSSLHNIPANDILGKTSEDILPAEQAINIKQKDAAIFNNAIATETEETFTKNNEPHTFISTRFPLRDNENNIYAVCCISSDITERMHKDEQIRRTQKMDALGKLTGGIAHDYNNMLGVILGYSELLKLEMRTNPKQLSYVDEIYKASERGAQLTKKLLSFSRQKISNSKVHDINAVLKEQQQMLEKTMTARIQVIFNLADDLWSVQLDSNDLIDAVINMSINAMHAIEGNGKLTIKTYNESINTLDAEQLHIEEGDYVLLSLTDTGAGMDNETREKVFDPFFSTKGDLGTGLGMSQVYGFVERSKGIIKLYSEPGHGTRITLYFPRDFDGNSTENSDSQDIDASALTGNETILVVDDEKSLLRLTENILSNYGYNILTAKNGLEALDTLEKEHEKISLVLTDVIMPEMDGYELARKIQALYPLIKIQMASGFSDDRHTDVLDDSLHENLLHKPYHSITLLKRLRELLS